MSCYFCLQRYILFLYAHKNIRFLQEGTQKSLSEEGAYKVWKKRKHAMEKT